MKFSTACVYASSVGLCSRSQRAMGSSLKHADPPPAFCEMLEVVSLLRTTSIMPISSPVATHPYAFRQRSRPALCHRRSINPIICSVSMSWRRSSPALKMMMTGSPVSSALPRLSQTGSFLLSMKRHLAGLTLLHSRCGSNGSRNFSGSVASVSIPRRVERRSGSFVVLIASAAARKCDIAPCSLTSSERNGPQRCKYASRRSEKRCWYSGTCTSAFRCQNSL
mmetsp:Transcript_12641/g.41664  ORF Transcript_12641/g.41664 Transcript_12641/m.41664 type:complete len:223 (+) Transcript_12641:1133-1801(+)